MKFYSRLCLMSFMMMASSFSNAAESVAAHDTSHCSPDGIAVGGFDLVSYHTENQAVKGDSQWSTEYNKLVHQFSSAENLQLFIANPEQYLPKFSGWCAIALAKNKLTCPDYENFAVQDGELLLFETFAFTNGRHVWNRKPGANLQSAQQNYDRFFEQ
ncbi:MAG: YHS domain-containing (seleno)protein [Pseudomonadales bacterium]